MKKTCKFYCEQIDLENKKLLQEIKILKIQLNEGREKK